MGVTAADRYDLALTAWLSLGAADLDSRIGEVANDLGIDLRLLDQPTNSLSGGEAARIGLAALLLSRFDVYLLDEPTNDLDLGGLDRLERWVLANPAPMLIVSHDRRFLDRVITDVAEIDQFQHTLSLFGGGWSAYLEERERATTSRMGTVRRVRLATQGAGRSGSTPTRVGPAGPVEGEEERRVRQAHSCIQDEPDRAVGWEVSTDQAGHRSTGTSGQAARSLGTAASKFQMSAAAATWCVACRGLWFVTATSNSARSTS